ncbi:MAG: glucosaminidase domain-containing protein [Tannerella sp.]|nr:glucosaminidase domain-containing protein [Tannerella sp.]
MKLYIRCTLFILALVAANTFQANAIRRTQSFEKYIKKYKDEAVRQQKKYKIPASITLAQALLESNAGESSLAMNANNHFGIKCHTDWKGAKAYHDDETDNECFRKYRNVNDSYEDHSRFLTERSRYAPLFTNKMTDYRGWAKGLQECGYATDRGYANKLIDIIETYELYNIGKDSKTKESTPTTTPATPLAREVYKTHGLIYVIATDFDSVEKIAADMGFKAKKLYKFNEIPEGFPLEKGDIVYLEKKLTKASEKYPFHTVRVGDSMHSISQLYGIKMKNLYKLNKKEADFVPEEGDVLKLR